MRFRPVALLVVIHILLTFGGLMLHLRIHPPTKSLYFWWAAPTGAFSLLLIPFLYLRPSTVAWALVGVPGVRRQARKMHALINP